MLPLRLKSLRKEHKKTQQDLASAIGITRPAYTAYESGNRVPDVEMLNKLADYFDVSVDYLLGRTNLKYKFDPNHEYADFEDFMNDPILMDFLKNDLKDITPEKMKKLKMMYEIINNE